MGTLSKCHRPSASVFSLVPIPSRSVSAGRVLNCKLGQTIAPVTGLPSASTTIPPIDQAASSSAVNRGGIGSAWDSDDQREVRAKAGNCDIYVEVYRRLPELDGELALVIRRHRDARSIHA